MHILHSHIEFVLYLHAAFLLWYLACFTSLETLSHANRPTFCSHITDIAIVIHYYGKNSFIIVLFDQNNRPSTSKFKWAQSSSVIGGSAAEISVTRSKSSTSRLRRIPEIQTCDRSDWIATIAFTLRVRSDRVDRIATRVQCECSHWNQRVWLRIVAIRSTRSLRSRSLNAAQHQSLMTLPTAIDDSTWLCTRLYTRTTWPTS